MDNRTENALIALGATLLGSGVTLAFGAYGGIALAVVGAAVFAVILLRKPAAPPKPPAANIIATAGWLQKVFGDAPQRDSGIVATLFVSNLPLDGVPSPTVSVVAHVELVDAHNRKVSVVGRWGDSKVPDHPNEAPAPVIIAPGITRCLDLAINFQGERDVWYPVDYTSPFHNYRHLEGGLTPTVVFSVRLVGDVDRRFVAWLRKEGENGFSINSRPATSSDSAVAS